MEKRILLIILLMIFFNSLMFGFYFSWNKGSNITGEVISNIRESKTEEGFVTKIIDGDTVIINGESVRLLGIDCDERGYPCYKDAKDRIEELLLNKKVVLEIDGENRDKYGRLLRYIFLDGENINLKLVKEGLAVARFSYNDKYKDEILEAEQKARENGVGCKWGGKVVKDVEVIEVDKDKEVEREEVKDEKIKDEGDEKDKLPSGVINVCDAKNYIGKVKTIQGKVVDSYKYKNVSIFLNFGDKYPDNCFTALIWADDWDNFPKNPEKYYLGEVVRIKGKVVDYKGRAEIILGDKGMIEVVGG